MHLRLIVIIPVFLLGSLSAQNKDSLLKVVTLGNDYDKCSSLIELSKSEIPSDTNQAFIYSRQALLIARHLNNSDLLAKAFYNIGRLFAQTQQYDSSKIYLRFAYDYWPENSNDDQMIDLVQDMFLVNQNLDQHDSSIMMIDGILNSDLQLLPRQKANLLILYSRALYFTSRYELSNQRMEEALVILGDLKDTATMVDMINKISTNYRKLGNYKTAVEYSHRALELNEKTKNLLGEAESFSTLGGIYYYMNDNEQAIKCFKQALEIFEKLNEPGRIAATNNNIGSVYNEMGKLEDALKYFIDARDRYKALKSDYALAILTDNIGLAYSGLEQNDKALVHFNEALLLFQKVGNKDGYTHCLVNLAGLYRKKLDTKKALDTYLKALDLAKELDLGNEKLQIYSEISSLYEQMGKFKDALDAYKLYQQTSDTLRSNESVEQLNQMRAKLDLKDRENRIVLLSKENELANTRYQKQRVFTLSVIVIALMVVILLVIVVRALQFSRRAKTKLEEQNRQITLQRNEIQFKNKQLTDSIHYANRVQEALFVPIENLKEYITDYFLISKPHSIVSGDFYWYKCFQNNLFVALADCTGHGVPGALMSMLGNALLNEIVDGNLVLSTDEIMNQFREKIKTSLHQTDMTGNTDGLDFSICRIDLNTLEMQFSGAFQPVFILSQGQITELKADKMPVSVNRNERAFTVQQHQLLKGDLIYFSTDGYYDQFGDGNVGKITKGKLKSLLEEIHNQSLGQQREVLDDYFTHWKGAQEQTDDVTVLGILI